MRSVPLQIGPYRVLRPLGRGGMGAVYLARDTRLDRQVALKLFSGADATSSDARDQLLREARAAAALNHVHIASLHDVLEVQGQVGLVFEFVEGETLDQRVKRGRVAPSDATRIALQLTEALTAAHQQGIVHRDLKPANIALTTDDVVKVLDFGVARVIPAGADERGTARTTAHGFVGTVGYAAPEQCLGQSVDTRADLFSLGVVLFEMLTGRPPFGGGDASAVVQAMLSGDAPRVRMFAPDVPPELDGLVARLLARDPSRRPATAQQVRDVLDSLAPTDAATSHVRLSTPPRWGIAALLVVGVVTAALVGVIGWGRTPAAADKPPVVAVLPLTNASGDASKDYLSVGVAESLITRLASLPSITVLSRAAVNEGSGEHTDPRRVSSALDASYLVDGSVQQVGERLRIDLRLVEPNGSVMWADDVEGSFAQIFDLQSRLASAVAQALSVRLSAADRAGLAQQGTSSPDALAAYWRGRELFERRAEPGNVERALAALDEAVRLDPNFADAHAARGEALWARYAFTLRPEDARAAVDAGTTALRLNPNRAEVRYTLAMTLAGTGQLDAAIEELHRALALRPNFDDARRELGNILARQGRIDEAILEFRKAIALRPNYWGHHSALGLRLWQAGRYDEALEPLKRVIELQPDAAIGYQQLGTLYQTMGRVDDALAQYEKANAIRPGAAAYSNIGTLRYRRGDYVGALAAYQEAIRIRPNSATTHANVGDALRRLGRHADAQRAYREATRLAKAALDVNPADPAALSAVGMYAAKSGDEDDAREYLARALEVAPDNLQVLSRAAVIAALTNRPDAAIEFLDRAVQRGYSRQLIAENDDFDTLRQRPGFKALLQEPTP